MAFIVPAGAVRKRSIINAFLNAGAVSHDSAKTLKEAGIFKGLGIKFGQLVESGIIVPCGQEKYYIDESKL